MKKLELMQELKDNAYPGRGIMLGKSKDERHAVIVYFIMGRSENSRNRIFVETENGIRTEAFEPEKMEDPSLIIYTPVCVMNDEITIVTNGDQTDTVAEALSGGQTFEDGLRSRTFEPDAPNYTPRISGLMAVKEGQMSYKLSILKSNGGMPDSPQRFFFEYPAPKAGEGHLIHTYVSDGDPIPSFEGEPKRVCFEGTVDEMAQTLWQNLNKDNKVSLFVRFIDIATGESETCIINKNVR